MFEQSSAILRVLRGSPQMWIVCVEDALVTTEKLPEAVPR